MRTLLSATAWAWALGLVLGASTARAQYLVDAYGRVVNPGGIVNAPARTIVPGPGYVVPQRRYYTYTYRPRTYSFPVQPPRRYYATYTFTPSVRGIVRDIVLPWDAYGPEELRRRIEWDRSFMPGD